jgi:putative ABC transport system ATP-binding protein
MTPSTAPIVELDDVHKIYGGGETAHAALDGVTLRIEPRAFVSLLGPSGSGKTTLLNLVAGLDVPSRGRVALDGHDLGTLSDRTLSDLRLRILGFVFQSWNLIPALRVADNVALPIEFLGATRTAVRRAVAEALDRTGVTRRARSYPGELSGGEQQRVAIARAIVSRPRILLADEPTGNLDTHAGRVVLDLLRSLNATDGTTIVMVTHNLFAATYGDRTLELRDGRIVRDVASARESSGA